MSETADIARRLVVRGRVQGVGFRDWTETAARDAGVSGWVRNRPDATVEVHAEGAPDAVDALVRAVHTGPSAARVDAVDVRAAVPEQPAGFIRRPTG